MSGILNLTQHAASADQVAAGVIDIGAEDRADLAALLTFDACPTLADVIARAERIAAIAAYADERTLCDEDSQDGMVRWDRAMIGGAPWLMRPLADALRAEGIEPLFAFSLRESVDSVQPDSSIRKTAVFRHAGWVPA